MVHASFDSRLFQKVPGGAKAWMPTQSSDLVLGPQQGLVSTLTLAQGRQGWFGLGLVAKSNFSMLAQAQYGISSPSSRLASCICWSTGEQVCAAKNTSTPLCAPGTLCKHALLADCAAKSASGPSSAPDTLGVRVQNAKQDFPANQP